MSQPCMYYFYREAPVRYQRGRGRVRVLFPNQGLLIGFLEPILGKEEALKFIDISQSVDCFLDDGRSPWGRT